MLFKLKLSGVADLADLAYILHALNLNQLLVLEHIIIIIIIIIFIIIFIQVLFKLKLSGVADLADLAYILHALNLDSSQFLYMCIVAGCDFLPNIKGIGYQASQAVTRRDFFHELGSHRYAPSDYCKGFKQACAVFKHQVIYDLQSKRVRPLTVWESGEDEAQFSMACGEYPLLNN